MIVMPCHKVKTFQHLDSVAQFAPCLDLYDYHTMAKQLVLGSSSEFRQMMLKRLTQNFICISPDIDESAQAHESALTLVERLAHQKAQAIQAMLMPEQLPALIIGSDQVALCKGAVLGKPLSHENAVEQLQNQSGECVEFLTSTCILDTTNDQYSIDVDITRVYFKNLSQATIEAYLTAETPYKCCGAFKSEALGITLFDRIENNDPTALIGLPLITVAKRLAEFGYELLPK